MDLAQVASQVTVFLTPFLPYLTSLATETSKEVAKKFGDDIWTQAKNLWKGITDKSEGDRKLEAVAKGLSADPEDADLKAVFARTILKLLETHPELASDIASSLTKSDSIKNYISIQDSEARNIRQKLSNPGIQSAEIRRSKVGDITQEQ